MSEEFAFVTNMRMAISVNAIVAHPALFVKERWAKLICAMTKHVRFEWTSVVYLLNAIENVDREITGF